MKVSIISLLCASSLALAACGNDKLDTSNAAFVKDFLAGGLGGGGAATTSAVSPQEISDALAATDKPVLLVSVEETKTQGLFFGLSRNGAYQTYGTSTRLSLTARDGLLTASRGFGGDLMSSETEALLSALRHGGGTVTYKMEFLDGENHTQILEATCSVTAGQHLSPEAAGTSTSVQQMSAACSTQDGTSFTNTFFVDPSGQVAGFRQWMGELIGYVSGAHVRG